VRRRHYNDHLLLCQQIRIALSGRRLNSARSSRPKSVECSGRLQVLRAQSAHYPERPRRSQAMLTDQRCSIAPHTRQRWGLTLRNRQQRPRADGVALAEWLKPIMIKIATEGKTARLCDIWSTDSRDRQFFRLLHASGSITPGTSAGTILHIVSTHPYSYRLNTLRIARKPACRCAAAASSAGRILAARLDMMFTLREIGVDVIRSISLRNPGTPAGESAEAAADGIPQDHHHRACHPS